MKVLALFTLLIASVGAYTASDIRGKLRGFHQSSMYNGQVARTPFSVGSYQLTAREQTVARYNGVSPNPSDMHLKNYYALACIYASTNGKPNPRTPIAENNIPNWSTSTGWVSDPDYCTWHGITCESGFVSEINLKNNTLYGTWPAEVAFLGETLTSIDLYSNFFNYCETYQWFQSMTHLNYLFFGTTSWDSNGIPSVLKFLTNLFEIDFSNSYWRGYLNPDAFTGSKDLYYIDMGDNFYSLRNLDSVPQEFTELPIVRLFMDNIEITDGGTLNLDFVGKMPMILEFWADFTSMEGGIPENIGDATFLQSLSLTYCGLTGIIPASLANTDIDRMWLFANRLTGSFPSALASQSWKYLFFEENPGMTGVMPQGICNQAGGNALIGLGADCNICNVGDCCTCCGGVGCDNLEDPTSAPTSAPAPAAFCFSGDSEVEVKNKGTVKMMDLSIGDSVKVAENSYELVYSFGHKNSEVTAEFLQISTSCNCKPLEISKDHMLVVEGGRNVPASMVKIGDKLVTSLGEVAIVTAIRNIFRTGVYAPFTQSGCIVVNNIVASNYVAFQGSEYLKISGVVTPFSYQWLAHTFNSVHRVAFMMGFTDESYTETGVSTWVDFPNKAGTWLLSQNFIVALGLLLPSIVIFGFVSIIEASLRSPMTAMTIITGAISWIVTQRSVSFTTTANKM